MADTPKKLGDISLAGAERCHPMRTTCDEEGDETKQQR